MNRQGGPQIVFSEWLHTGVVAHFEDGVCAFFPARFLLEHRHELPNVILQDLDGLSHDKEDGA